jgi:hypothetical protein
MTTIISNSKLRLDFNGSKTYMVIDSPELFENESCIFATSSLVKAKNYFNKISKQSNAI